MAIYRDFKPNPTSDEVQFRISYTASDIKRLFILYLAMVKDFPEMMDEPESESSIRYWLETDQRAFGSFAHKYSNQLSKWAVNVAFRNKFIETSVQDENKFIFSETIKTKARNYSG